MTEKQKPNFNDAQYDHHYYGNQEYKNSFGEASHLPVSYPYRYNTDDFYEEESSNAGSFLLGALVGGVIGAAAALFLAPKTGKEMRDDFSEQATQLKNKSIELSTVAKDKANEFSSVAKDKATEFSSVAKEKTEGITKTIQEQSGQIVDKVKSMANKTTIPMDDGTVSSEGEEAIDYVESSTKKNKEAAEDKSTKNSDVSYDNSENIGKEKMMNQNQISVEKEK